LGLLQGLLNRVSRILQIGNTGMPRSSRSSRHLRLMTILKAGRNAAGMTQQQAAARLGRPQSFIAKYEVGERRLDVVELIEVCDVIGLDPQRLIAELVSIKGE
jgi:DNA-binding transcriptional regulator YiaG